MVDIRTYKFTGPVTGNTVFIQLNMVAYEVRCSYSNTGAWTPWEPKNLISFNDIMNVVNTDTDFLEIFA